MAELAKVAMPELRWTKRYEVNDTVDEPPIEEVPRETSSFLMAALNPSMLFHRKPLSPAAKVDDDGVVVTGEVDRLLPRTDITARLIQQSQMAQAVGTARETRDFPYKLKAVGFVNPWDILNGTGVRGSSLVSQDVELTP